jgi:lambda family phage tail tape measure protein
MIAGTLEIQMLLNMAKITDQLAQTHGAITGFVGKINALLSTIGLGFGLSKVLETTLEFEKSSVRIDAILRATGNSAGFTRGQLDEMATTLAHTTPFDETQIRNAEVNLLKFGKITGDTFRDALKASLDLAAATGRDVPAAAQMLGRAIVDPLTGMRRLAVEFGGLDYSTKRYIETALAHGQAEKERAAVIDFVMGKVGGTAAQSNTGWTGILGRLAKAWDAVGEASEKAIQRMEQNAKRPQAFGRSGVLEGDIFGLAPSKEPEAKKPLTWEEQFARQQADLARMIKEATDKENDQKEAHARAVPVLKQWGLAVGEVTKLQEAQMMIEEGIAQFWPRQDQVELKRIARKLDLLKVNRELFQSNAAALSQQASDREHGEATTASYLVGAGLRHKQMEQEILLIGQTAYEQDKLNALYDIELREREALNALGTIQDPRERARLSGDVIAASRREREQVLSDLARRREAERAWVTGVKQVFNEYVDAAGNAANSAREFFSNAFSSMENAVRVSNGRIVMDFRSMTDQILTDLLRIFVMRRAIAAGAAASGGFFGSLFGPTTPVQNPEAIGGFATGTDYVPRTGTYLLHQGERVTPAAQNKSGDTYVIDARGADPAGLARLEAMIRSLNGSIERRALSAYAVERLRAPTGALG